MRYEYEYLVRLLDKEHDSLMKTLIILDQWPDERLSALFARTFISVTEIVYDMDEL